MSTTVRALSLYLIVGVVFLILGSNAQAAEPHFQAPVTLAQGLKAALDHTNSRR